jgi:argininosuccinate lyase
MSRLRGRFRTPMDPGALAFSSSLPVDRRLAREDIEGSLAHAAMLAAQGILPARSAKRIVAGLKRIAREIDRSGVLPATPPARTRNRMAADDVHMAVEAILTNRIGQAAGMLHTARSRNDQVALDERLFLKKRIAAIRSAIRKLQRAFLRQARRHARSVVPGYTHLQRAQPVLFAHHLLAYVAMLQRDAERFGDCLARVDRSPLGAGAMAGTTFPIDRRRVARALGFRGLVENSIDAVSDRDVQIEFLAACAITMMHLSRLGEELVLWSSSEWEFAVIGEGFTTGSSIMPQKRNPDIAELIRGKSGRVYGNLVALLTVMKGLALAYNRDLQEDKEPLIDSARTVEESLTVAAAMLGSTRFRPERFAGDMKQDAMLATDLADYLARKGLPFRKAHAVVGEIVRLCAERGVSLRDLSLKEYRSHSPLFDRDALGLLSPLASVRAKRSEGSTHPREVDRQIRRWDRILGAPPPTAQGRTARRPRRRARR